MGHNRGWEEAASMLSGSPVELKTCNAALLEATGKSWDEVRFHLLTRWHIVTCSFDIKSLLILVFYVLFICDSSLPIYKVQLLEHVIIKRDNLCP